MLRPSGVWLRCVCRAKAVAVCFPAHATHCITTHCCGYCPSAESTKFMLPAWTLAVFRERHASFWSAEHTKVNLQLLLQHADGFGCRYSSAAELLSSSDT